MNKFEAVLLISPVLSNIQLKKELEKFDTLINNHSGKFVNKEDWG